MLANQNSAQAQPANPYVFGTAEPQPTTQEQAAEVVVKAVDWRQVQDSTLWVGSVEVPWDQWHAIPAHPVQRVTSKHAAQLVMSGVLEKPLDIHRSVAAVVVGDTSDAVALFRSRGAAVLSGANVNKIDGHSRTLAQANAKAPKPASVIVNIWAASDQAASAALYQAFDSSVSSKKTADKGQSALRAAGIEPQSSLMQAGGVVLKALKLADAIINEGTVHTKTVNAAKRADAATEELTLDQAMAALVPGLALAKRYYSELLLLDGLNIAQRIMPANADAIAAYLAILVKDPTQGMEFLTQLRAGKGESVDGQADALFMAAQAVKMAADKRKRLRGNDRVAAIIATLLNTFNGYKTSEVYDAARAPSSVGVIASMFEAERKAAAKAAK